jgi:hypothetical protein
MTLVFTKLQATEGDSITYNLKDKLEWTDFKMNPDLSNSSKIYLDVTIATFTKKVDIWWGIITVESFAGVIRDKSWVKPDFQSDLLLEYVQLKYEIANFYAKSCEKEINKKKINAAFTNKISKIIEKYIDKMNLTFKKYDLETDFGDNQEMMDKWKAAVANGNL